MMVAQPPKTCCEKMVVLLRLNEEAAESPRTGIKLTADHHRAVVATLDYVATNRCPFCGAKRPLRDKSEMA